jgi:hypothetical protein
MTSCTYDIPRSACSVALETYHGASTIILRILDRLLWIIDILDIAYIFIAVIQISLIRAPIVRLLDIIIAAYYRISEVALVFR